MTLALDRGESIEGGEGKGGRTEPIPTRGLEGVEQYGKVISVVTSYVGEAAWQIVMHGSSDAAANNTRERLGMVSRRGCVNSSLRPRKNPVSITVAAGRSRVFGCNLRRRRQKLSSDQLEWKCVARNANVERGALHSETERGGRNTMKTDRRNGSGKFFDDHAGSQGRDARHMSARRERLARDITQGANVIKTLAPQSSPTAPFLPSPDIARPRKPICKFFHFQFRQIKEIRELGWNP